MDLDSNFEDALRESILDDAEQKARDEIGPRLEEIARENWQDYANENGYDIDHIWEDATLEVARDADSVSIRIEWSGLAALYEFGVDPFTQQGNPTLAFEWQSPPEGTRPPGAPGYVVADEVNWGSVTGGIGESRAIRDAMNEIRRELE